MNEKPDRREVAVEDVVVTDFGGTQHQMNELRKILESQPRPRLYDRLLARLVHGTRSRRTAARPGPETAQTREHAHPAAEVAPAGRISRG